MLALQFLKHHLDIVFHPLLKLVNKTSLIADGKPSLCLSAAAQPHKHLQITFLRAIKAVKCRYWLTGFHSGHGRFAYFSAPGNCSSWASGTTNVKVTVLWLAGWSQSVWLLLSDWAGDLIEYCFIGCTKPEWKYCVKNAVWAVIESDNRNHLKLEK